MPIVDITLISQVRVAETQAIAGAVAAVPSRPIDRVHVILEPDAAGRVYFGGRPRQG